MNETMACPECKGKFDVKKAREDKCFPFCSWTCKNLDLYKWFNEEYCISEKNPHTNEGD
jgi:endogenous inhibitor of DNA gyrase (YacG/DUF329 family)